MMCINVEYRPITYMETFNSPVYYQLWKTPGLRLSYFQFSLLAIVAIVSVNIFCNSLLKFFI
jgi:hypothetical protein